MESNLSSFEVFDSLYLKQAASRSLRFLCEYSFTTTDRGLEEDGFALATLERDMISLSSRGQHTVEASCLIVVTKFSLEYSGKHCISRKLKVGFVSMLVYLVDTEEQLIYIPLRFNIIGT